MRPECFVLAYPAFVNLADGYGVEGVDPLASFGAGNDEARCAEHVHVLHHAKAGEVWKALDHFAGGPGFLAQQIEDLPARGIGECPARARASSESGRRGIRCAR